MELALYCPVYGYYERERDTSGKCGDFYTSVSVGSLFGELLAFQFAEWLSECEKQNAERAARSEAGAELQLVEAGAHDGRLAADILGWMRNHRPQLFQRLAYCIVEPSPRRRQWQKQTLAEFGNKVRWLPSLLNGESARIRGVIFSNELLDALPSHRFGWDANQRAWFEWGVTMQDGLFAWARLKPEADSPMPQVQTPILPWEAPGELLEVLPDGFTMEVCPAAESWWREAANALERGRLLTIDYGLAAEEFFAPERKQGTLRAYSQHRLVSEVLARPGDQDITAHVNFTSIRAAGESAGLKTEDFVTQEQFLTRIAARVWKEKDASAELIGARAREFQTLTHPEHLGRPFRVLVQSRGL